MAFRVSRLVAVPFDDLLAGKYRSRACARTVGMFLRCEERYVNQTDSPYGGGSPRLDFKVAPSINLARTLLSQLTPFGRRFFINFQSHMPPCSWSSLGNTPMTLPRIGILSPLSS